jgi:hypothetical protein
MLEYRFDLSYFTDVVVEYLSFSRVDAILPCPNRPLLYSRSARILNTSLYLSVIVSCGSVDCSDARLHADELPTPPPLFNLSFVDDLHSLLISHGTLFRITPAEIQKVGPDWTDDDRETGSNVNHNHNGNTDCFTADTATPDLRVQLSSQTTGSTRLNNSRLIAPHHSPDTLLCLFPPISPVGSDYHILFPILPALHYRRFRVDSLCPSCTSGLRRHCINTNDISCYTPFTTQLVIRMFGTCIWDRGDWWIDEIDGIGTEYNGMGAFYGYITTDQRCRVGC